MEEPKGKTSFIILISILILGLLLMLFKVSDLLDIVMIPLFFLVISPPIGLIVGTILALNKDQQKKKKGKIILLASLTVIVIGFSICTSIFNR